MNTEDQPTSNRASLGETIRAGRETAGLSLRECAELVGVHYSYLSRLESGENGRPAPETLQRLAEVLELDAAELLAFIGVKPAMPEPKAYFRKVYGMNDSQATEAAEVIANLREHQRLAEQSTKKGRTNDDTN